MNEYTWIFDIKVLKFAQFNLSMRGAQFANKKNGKYHTP